MLGPTLFEDGIVAWTGAEGGALFSSVPAGESLEVGCAAPDHYPTLGAQRLDAGSAGSTVEQQLATVAALDVEIIVSAGSLPPQTEVHLLPRGGIARSPVSRPADGDGKAAFHALPAGDWRILVSPFGRSQEVRLEPGKHHREVIRIQ